LSKVLAPPSPTAVDTPKTPPESPAIFHYSLPSPGMASPLSLFESMDSADSSCDAFSFGVEPWVEQVDFRLPEDQWTLKKKSSKPKSGNLVPSLEEITARLSRPRPGSPPLLVAKEARATRLPSFLRTAGQEQSVPAPAAKTRPTLPIGVGRLQMPIRNVPASTPQPSEHAPLQYPSPKSPVSPKLPKLQITTLVVPRTATMSPTNLSKSNLLALNACNERTSQDMKSALKRQTFLAESALPGQDDGAEDRKSRRNSSPADLPPLRRAGFEHPVLSMAGGF